MTSTIVSAGGVSQPTMAYWKGTFLSDKEFVERKGDKSKSLSTGSVYVKHDLERKCVQTMSVVDRGDKKGLQIVLDIENVPSGATLPPIKTKAMGAKIEFKTTHSKNDQASGVWEVKGPVGIGSDKGCFQVSRCKEKDLPVFQSDRSKLCSIM